MNWVAPLIIGHFTDRVKLEEDLKNLDTHNGKYLSKFLSDCNCVGTIQEAEDIIQQGTSETSNKCQSMSEYEQNVVVYKNHILHEKTDIIPAVVANTNSDPYDDTDEVKTLLKFEKGLTQITLTVPLRALCNIHLLNASLNLYFYSGRIGFFFYSHSMPCVFCCFGFVLFVMISKGVQI